MADILSFPENRDSGTGHFCWKLRPSLVCWHLLAGHSLQKLCRIGKDCAWFYAGHTGPILWINLSSINRWVVKHQCCFPLFSLIFHTEAYRCEFSLVCSVIPTFSSRPHVLTVICQCAVIQKCSNKYVFVLVAFEITKNPHLSQLALSPTLLSGFLACGASLLPWGASWWHP